MRRDCKENGVWAFDCEYDEPVLIIIPVLSMLGDNPMQSEMACHTGLHAKYFCRACHVKGTDATEDAERVGQASLDGSADVAGGIQSDHESGSESDASASGSKPPKKRGARAVESMQQMLHRVKEFMKVSACLSMHF